MQTSKPTKQRAKRTEAAEDDEFAGGSWSDLLETGVFWRLLKDGLRRQGGIYAIAVVAMVVAALAAAASAWVMEGIVDAMTDTGNRARVNSVAAMVAGIFTVKGLASYIQSVYMKRAGNRIVAIQQERLYLKMVGQGVAFFDKNESSGLLMRVTNSAEAARQMLDLIVTSAVRDTLTLAGLIAVMFYQQPLLSLVSLVIGPIAIISIRVLLRKVRAIMENELSALSEIIKIVQETSGGIRIIKVFSLEDRMIGRMKGAITQVEHRANSIARLESIASPLMETLSGFAIAAVVLISSVNLMGGEPTSPGQLMSFVTALLMAYEPAKRLSRVRVTLERLMARVRLMFEILDQPDVMLEADDAKDLVAGPGEVRFENVSFGYGKKRPVPEGSRPDLRGGQDHRAGGAVGQRQVDDLQPRHAALRSDQGPGHGRWAGPEGRDLCLAARPDILCRTGHVPVCHHDHGKHPLQPSGCQ